MSSDKRRLKLRLKRLQETFQSLGKDPNAKEYEVKSLTMDFDRVARKQIARLKKAKHQRLQTRQEILITYGMRSRERITIDEEITSMMKNFEADQKRLRAIMLNFDEKKPDMQEAEKVERNDLIQMIKDSFNLFKIAYNDQTTKMERGAGTYVTDVSHSEISYMGGGPGDQSKSSSRLRGNAGQPLKQEKENETQHAFLEESVAMQSKSARGQTDFNLEFDNLIHRIMRRLEEIEKKWVLGEYDFDDVAVDPYAIKFDNLQQTMKELRTPNHVYFDIFLIVTSLALVTLCLQLLYMKGYVSDYHIQTLPT